ncbi:alpha/beta hydrolase [Rhodococcus rhodnii]|uniref:alpha/beta hydrolase n=1 Tax=Rhodococcus rhodnii TaxID=38312 RepID=UPI000592F7DE
MRFGFARNTVRALVVLVAAAVLAPAGPAFAQTTDRLVEISVYSEAMGREIPLRVLRPADTSVPRPTLYLLNGAGGGEDAANWFDRTDIREFFADENVNVVVPMSGAFNYYTDWIADDPELGRHKWTTFLTSELPPQIDARFGTTGVNALAGISMAGTSVLSLAQSAPELYRSVGAYSGCAETSTPLGRLAIQLVVEARGGGDTENMWGSPEGGGWEAHDPVVNAERLRGIDLYVSSGSGLPGQYDRLDAPGIEGDVELYANQMLLGTTIEAATNVCTHRLAHRLGELGIPATFDFRPTGTHSWMYWQEQLHASWPLLRAALTR